VYIFLTHAVNCSGFLPHGQTWWEKTLLWLWRQGVHRFVWRTYCGLPTWFRGFAGKEMCKWNYAANVK
jgi:hypothetical protein